jgi:hypothetical protein
VSELSNEQREELARWAQSRTLPAGDIFRARLILALAEGKTLSQIEIELQTSRPTITRWKQRFEQEGMAWIPSIEGVNRVGLRQRYRPACYGRQRSGRRMGAPTGVAAKWQPNLS